jgi:hypothetical protein
MRIDFVIKNGLIDGVRLRDASRKERQQNVHHWEAIVPAGKGLQSLVQELASVRG